IYTHAISDAYQDLFGEGIFTGKGIYEAATLHAVLNQRFPRNSLLSHDLIEGAYARVGLVTDIELVDDYPSHYSAYSRRQHRWLRGDWQIAQWIFSRVPDEAGRWGPNPISDISRWKILDNMRRSLLDPSLLILFVAGWLGLPGGPLYWTIVPLMLLIFPALVQLAFGLGRAYASGQKGHAGEALSGFWRAAFIALLHLVFLAQMTFLTFDAILRSMIRGFITGERLLEWETAAQAEIQSGKRSAIDRYLGAIPLVAAGLAALVWFVAPHRDAIFCAAPILLLWALASPVIAWLDRPPRERLRLVPADCDFLLLHALRIWRYFSEFGVEKHNYLVPDNVEEEESYETARISPTNIGLLLNARQTACELGFLTVPEFVALTRHSLSTIARLEKLRGHLYNWYDTHTLQVLGGGAPFVSSVDSGNFVASLHTLQAGARDLARRPLLEPQLFTGLRAHWRLMHSGRPLPAAIARLRVPRPNSTLSTWASWLPSAQAALAEAADSHSAEPHSAWWLAQTQSRIEAILKLLRDYLPWTLAEYEPLRASSQLGFDNKADPRTIHDALLFAEDLDARLARAWLELAENPVLGELGERLREALPAATHNLRDLAAGLREIAQDAERFAEETGFDFLAEPDRQVLSIGYDAGKRRIETNCYDLVASEARVATFLAIARGDIPQQSWFKLSRDHTHAYGRFILHSWTGTMFEYLMPALWMRSYPGTLVARTQAACVAVQQAFARTLNIPWGISESGYARRDYAGHYLYKAYGVPRIALSPDATAGPVISPYSTFLALGVDTTEALLNLRRMNKLGWVGAYGFYEAADYIDSPREPVLIREWMAHHQGMSLLAVANLLCDNVVQRWFHSNPLVQSAERLLHEVPESEGALRSRLYELAPLRAD
ncbi:MAG: glucoamylase family protein, partial [Terracidiphilus sp.]